MNVTHFVTLYVHKRLFIVTFKVPAHMYTSFSIIIRYTDNISSHDIVYALMLFRRIFRYIFQNYIF